MGSLDHKNFGALHPQFGRARTATEFAAEPEPTADLAYIYLSACRVM